MNRAFYQRLLVVVLLTLSGAFVFGLAALLPSYFISTVKNDIAQRELSAQSVEPMPTLDAETEKEIKTLDAKLSIIEKAERNKFTVSTQVIREVIAQKLSDIKITQIIFDAGGDGAPKITVSGIAPSRERLLLYRQALEQDVNFKNVLLPISNFVKGSNIEFSLTLTPAP